MAPEDVELPEVNPQVRALLRAMGDVSGPAAAEPTPAELAAERAEYLDATLRLGGAAELLQVHPNTAQYRLRRIEERTGRNPRCVRDLLELLVAIALEP